MTIRKPCLFALIAIAIFVFSASIVRIACEVPESTDHFIMQRNSAAGYDELPANDIRSGKVLPCDLIDRIIPDPIILYLEKQTNSPPPQLLFR